MAGQVARGLDYYKAERDDQKKKEQARFDYLAETKPVVHWAVDGLAFDAKDANAETVVVRQIEDLLIQRLPSWQYAIKTVSGEWAAPCTSSTVAEALGNPKRWREVKGMIMRREIWNRIYWYKSPPPDGHSSSRNSQNIQWVAIGKGN